MLFQIRAPEIEKVRFIFSVLARLFQTELRTVPTIVIAHTLCASPDTRISSRQCLLVQ